MARVLYWFRTDLRLHDSPALQGALDLKPEALFPVWCWDPNYIYKHRVGLNRFRFLLESMQDVSNSIKAINPASQLLVVRGDPVELLPELFKRWKISHIVFEKDPSGYARRRDEQVIELAKKNDVEVIQRNGHYLYDVEEVVKKNGGKPTMSMKALQGIISKMDDPPRAIEKPKSLPSPLLKKEDKEQNLSHILKELNESLRGLPAYNESSGAPDVDLNSAALGGQRRPDGKVTCYDSVIGPDDDDKSQSETYFTVPTLESLGMDPESCNISSESAVPGGEHEALSRLEKIVKDSSYIATFAKPKSSPAQDHTDPSTTLLSPFLKFGCLSIRKLWYDTHESSQKYKGKGKTTIPENYEGQVLFREMYACAELAVGDSFQVMKNNSVCRYMDWYLPTHVDSKTGAIVEPRPKGDEESEKRLEAFRAGQTGFPWIDAGARQLRSTGWIHHLMRHSLASFLTRGHCWISWERGAEMFEEYLLDWDPNSNAGNWMWLSCSAFFAQFFRVYGAATFPVKYDKSGTLVRKYCPELKDYPDKYIYSPHTAPLEVQKKANCIIGQDYPFPMLDEKEEKARCLNRIKTAYSHKFYGTSKEVKEGKAEEILRKAHGEPHPAPPKQAKGTDDKIPDWAKAGSEAKTNGGVKKEETKKKDDSDRVEEDKRESGSAKESKGEGGKRKAAAANGKQNSSQKKTKAE
ncbi:hypothetical protein CBS101457_006632 [Exobasidium rhododendri]|nr:hypothetical protein CBS101457_006632 [Exobasidium rhododendri]